MASNARFAEVAALLGDPSRAAMLHALMDGRALTARELAHAAGVAPQTASGHLTRLVATGVLSVEKQGRHRYHRLASQNVARMMESLMLVASTPERARAPLRVGPRDLALRAARTCYDHLAGRLGVALADSLIGGGYVELTEDAGVVTRAGVALLGRLGLDLDALSAGSGKRPSRIVCRPCLDWSERRPHLAGSVGAALCTHSFSDGWIRRIHGTRAIAITPKGERVFREEFGVRLG